MLQSIKNFSQLRTIKIDQRERKEKRREFVGRETDSGYGEVGGKIDTDVG